MNLKDLRERFGRIGVASRGLIETPEQKPPATIRTASAASLDLGVSSDYGEIVHCVDEGGEIRVKPAGVSLRNDQIVASDARRDYNVRFPREWREVGAFWLVTGLVETPGCEHYTTGDIVLCFTEEQTARLTAIIAEIRGAEEP